MRKDKYENFNKSLVDILGSVNVVSRYRYKNTKIQTRVTKNIVCTKG